MRRLERAGENKWKGKGEGKRWNRNLCKQELTMW
jgi:hypothetical protein